MGIISDLADRVGGTARRLGSAAGVIASEALDGYQEELTKARGLKPKKGDKASKDAVGGPPRDPFGIVEWTEEQATGYGGVGNVNPLFVDRPGPANILTYRMLEGIARQPIVAAVHGARANEIGELARPQPDRYSLGYKMRLREVRRKPKGAEIKEAERLERFMQRCGNREDSDLARHETFEAFLRKITRQTYTWDQVNFEVQHDPLGRPAAFQTYDPKTIRRVLKSSSMKQAQNVDFVQVWQNKIWAGWTANEMCFGVRRPRSDLEAMGYGFPEPEELVNTLTYLLWAENYNAAAFKQGALAEGVLQIIGDMPRKQLRGLRRQFKAMLTGISNAARLAIVNLPASTGKEKVDLLRFKQSNREMEFREWINFLLKVVCAIYQIDPAQIGFVFGAEGQTQSLTERGPMERVQISKDKGLRPLLRFIEYLLNAWIIWPLNPDFEFAFVGLDSISEQEKLDLDTKAVKAFKMVDEIRAEHDLEDMPDGKGQVILDPAWMNAEAQAKAMAAEAEMGGDEYEEGDEGPDEGPDDEPPDEDQGDEVEKPGEKPDNGKTGPPKPPKPPQPPAPPGGKVKKALNPRVIYEVHVDYEAEDEAA